MNRRAFLGAVSLGAGAALAAGSLALSNLMSWSGRRTERTSQVAALHAAVLAMMGGNVRVPRVEVEPEDAARKLLAGLEPEKVEALLASPRRLRTYFHDRQREDLRANRTRFIHGWLLSETEICIAGLIGRGRGR